MNSRSGGTYRAEVRTEVDGVVRTEVREGSVPPGGRVDIRVGTGTPEVRIHERASAGELRATSSKDVGSGASTSLDVFIASLWRNFTAIFHLFNW